jgi:hypothetical protein
MNGDTASFYRAVQDLSDRFVKRAASVESFRRVFVGFDAQLEGMFHRTCGPAH